MNNNEYAGFWIRTWASLLDTLFLMMILAPVAWALYGDDFFLRDSETYNVGDILLNYIFPAVIVIVFWTYKSATPGKMICKLNIVDAKTGGELSTMQCIGRYLAYYVSALPLFLGFIWVAFDSRKQGWHDKLSGTVVLRQRSHQ